MDIGKRLRELREADGLSQNDIEDRTGLLRTYISHVENGHSTPTLEVLEDLELYQLFVVGQGEPEAAVLPERIKFGAQARALLRLFSQMPAEDKALRRCSPQWRSLPAMFPPAGRPRSIPWWRCGTSDEFGASAPRCQPWEANSVNALR
jgi:transcriptional regulator with XRE-family HTH domain